MVSMKAIAQACGVSVATVSKALSNHNDIGIETKTRIRMMAKEMGYLPNSAAKALKTKRSDTVGVLYLDASNGGLTHDFFATVLNGFKETIEHKGYDITFINVSKNGKNDMSYLNHCRYRGFDGVLIACIDYDNEDVIELIESDIPVVMIDHGWPGKCGILSNNVKGMQDLMDFVISKGHRKIAYIHGDASSVVTQERVKMYRQMCERNNIPLRPEYLREGKYRDTVSSRQQTEALLALQEPPTCILYPDDFAAFGGMNALRDAGKRIPEDISIAGYDGTLLARSYQPELTTVAQNTEEMGRRAAELLVRMIEKPRSVEPRNIVIDGDLLQGESVAEYQE